MLESFERLTPLGFPNSSIMSSNRRYEVSFFQMYRKKM